MAFNLFSLLAVIGLLILTWGILTKKDNKRNFLFLIGGALLIIYSIYIKDIIIVAVQVIFTLAAGYKLWRKK
ncbi:YgjV family protein [Candidatus Pacearchaeota archaeon]|nr:YgjV family protein [Candidatus Pacearchaeota archaeon]